MLDYLKKNSGNAKGVLVFLLVSGVAVYFLNKCDDASKCDPSKEKCPEVVQPAPAVTAPAQESTEESND